MDLTNFLIAIPVFIGVFGLSWLAFSFWVVGIIVNGLREEEWEG